MHHLKTIIFLEIYNTYKILELHFDTPTYPMCMLPKCKKSLNIMTTLSLKVTYLIRYKLCDGYCVIYKIWPNLDLTKHDNFLVTQTKSFPKILSIYEAPEIYQSSQSRLLTTIDFQQVLTYYWYKTFGTND